MMRKIITSVTLSLGLAILPAVPSISRVPLQPIKAQKSHTTCCKSNIGFDEQLWDRGGQLGDKYALLSAIDNSLTYLQSPGAATAYGRYRLKGITRDRVLRSLVRFRQLVHSSRSALELQAAVEREFVLYQSTGKDGKGDVLFTAYYEPTYQASRVPTPEYRYPLYRLPPHFKSWSKPHPTRMQLEGKDGLLGAKSRLKGLEMVWLRDRLEAFLVQIQGSARLQLTDGGVMTVGYAGKTNYPYTSVGKELAKDGKLPLAGLTLPVMLQHFKLHPSDVNNYLPRHRGFVFFRETHGTPATGCLTVPLTAERSIATDKSLMPPGALALIHTQMPMTNDNGQIEYRTVSRYVLDQDTGSAIKGPGRVDYFMGTGSSAGDRAGVTGSHGKLYYLLLK